MAKNQDNHYGGVDQYHSIDSPWKVNKRVYAAVLEIGITERSFAFLQLNDPNGFYLY